MVAVSAAALEDCSITAISQAAHVTGGCSSAGADLQQQQQQSEGQRKRDWAKGKLVADKQQLV